MGFFSVNTFYTWVVNFRAVSLSITRALSLSLSLLFPALFFYISISLYLPVHSSLLLHLFLFFPLLSASITRHLSPSSLSNPLIPFLLSLSLSVLQLLSRSLYILLHLSLPLPHPSLFSTLFPSLSYGPYPKGENATFCEEGVTKRVEKNRERQNRKKEKDRD